ncbi:co-chaperone GroES [Texas Phoenix palm phytoplasma]|uniref:10 kDa chaperonin n=1 Tax=Texas Phoenix palm phytoplasma TaxID=176709 RepID=A0ABS5BI41_9MOLU|nr:co-chaperone GroES [Texas Phoenix palm phytoplasma]
MLKPLNDFVVIKTKEEKNVTKSGIILTLEKQTQDFIGIVLSCGPKVQEIKPNDEVVYKKYSGKVKINEKEFLIVKLEDILALVN